MTTPKQTPSAWMTLKEVADDLALGSTAANALAHTEGPDGLKDITIRIGKVLRVQRAGFERWCERKMGKLSEADELRQERRERAPKLPALSSSGDRTRPSAAALLAPRTKQAR